MRERLDRWAKEHPDEVRAKAKRFYDKNLEKERARALRWYHENRERASENGRKWRQANPDKQRAKFDRWATNNPERVIELRSKYYKRRKFGGDDPETIEYVGILRADPCSYCGEPGTSIEHIVPITGGGSNHWTNYGAACHSCNSRKHNMPLLTFLYRRSRQAA